MLGLLTLQKHENCMSAQALREYPSVQGTTTTRGSAVCEALWWSMVEHGGSGCSIVEHGGSRGQSGPWVDYGWIIMGGFKVVHGGAWWIIMEYNGSDVERGGSWWSMVDHNGSWWVIVDRRGSSWFMVVHGGA